MRPLTPFSPALTWQQQPSPLLSSAQKRWLARPGALTDGLRSIGKLELAVIDERAQRPAIDEWRRLPLAPSRSAWIREVVMSINGVPCVVARSLTDWRASTGVWRGIRQLGTRPLADMLYHDARVRRSRFEFTRLHPRQGLALTLSHWTHPTLNAFTQPSLFARRSVFFCHAKSLLVSECFLPSFWQLIGPQNNT